MSALRTIKHFAKMGKASSASGGDSGSDDDDFSLGGVFQEPERPKSPPPTVSTYTRPEQFKSISAWETVEIQLVGSHPLWGHHLWNAAKVFSNYLLEHRDTLVTGKNVLELGAGGALPGIVSTLAGASKTVITDYPDISLIKNMQYNVDQNVPENLRSSVNVLGHLWGANCSPLLECIGGSDSKFDLIILSDLVFNHSQHAALLKTCDTCLSSAQPYSAPSETSSSSPSSTPTTPCLLVFYTHHRPHLAEKDLDFFRLAREMGWECEEVVTERTGAMFEDDPGDIEVRAVVHGWRVWRKMSELD